MGVDSPRVVVVLVRRTRRRARALGATRASMIDHASPWTIAIAFACFDVFKACVSSAFDLEPLLELQREIARATKSLGRSAVRTSEDERATFERRLSKLRNKLRLLEGRRSANTRNAARAAHYASAGKAAAGVIFVFLAWEKEMFRLPSEVVYPLGAWLAAPLGREPGVVGVVPWVLLAAAGSDRGTRGALWPACQWLYGLAFGRR